MELKYPVYEPCLMGNEIKYVTDCLNTSWISSRGKYIERFENEFANFVGVDHAVSVCNGTVSLHLAMIALGIKEGDEVIVPTLTYVASVNAIKYVNATPVFVDSNFETWQINIEDLEKKITSKTKAIMVVHLYGYPCDMSSITKVCREKGIYIIEDCAEAIGTMYKGRHVGTFGDISSFSFYGNKTITTGEGGMVVTNNEEIAKKIYHLKMQGVSEIQYWHDIIGYNYKMTNICAAIGLAQIENIKYLLRQKNQIAEWYKECLSQTNIVFHESKNSEEVHSYWMCSILVNKVSDREKLRFYLLENGIETRPVFFPVHTMPMYQSNYDIKEFKNAIEISSRGFNLPSYPKLSKSDIIHITDKVKDFFSNTNE